MFVFSLIVLYKFFFIINMNKEIIYKCYLYGCIFSLIVELVNLDPEFDLARELGPAVGQRTGLGQLLLLHLPVASTAAEPGRPMAPHFYR